jgi:hypothetical protein
MPRGIQDAPDDDKASGSTRRTRRESRRSLGGAGAGAIRRSGKEQPEAAARSAKVCAGWRGRVCALEMSREVYFQIYLSNK